MRNKDNRYFLFQITSIHDFVKAFRTSGKFSVSVKTYRAFASKQTVPFEIILNNSRKVKISKLTVALIQVKPTFKFFKTIRYNLDQRFPTFSRHLPTVTFLKFLIPPYIIFNIKKMVCSFKKYKWYALGRNHYEIVIKTQWVISVHSNDSISQT